jgi:tetratricopeptide (TPR) repeat protein
MGEFLEKKDRNVVPQWRPFDETVAADVNEIRSLRNPRPHDDDRTADSAALASAVQAFHRNPSSWYATDLLAEAIHLGNASIGQEAAQFIFTSVSSTPAARSFAAAFLGVPEMELQLRYHERRAVKKARGVLRLHPHDAIAWADLAYGLTISGKIEAARRAMAVALNLEPCNRFILRSAARFYAHIGDFERALAVLRNSPRIKTDPWLVAAEVATARAAGERPRMVRPARELLCGDFAPRHLSELASALAMLEFDADKTKGAASKLFNKALQDPNDNTLAQATWYNIVKRGDHSDLRTKDVPLNAAPRSYEAHTIAALHDGDFLGVLENARLWFEDQPFAQRAIDMLAWAASSLSVGHNDIAIDALQRATITNPESKILWNNLAYSRALEGHTDDAARSLAKAERLPSDSPIDEVCVTATRGMLYFRQHDVDRGRQLYERSIEVIKEEHLDKRLLVSACANLAREEALAGTPQATPAMLRALQQAGYERHTPDVSQLMRVMVQQIASIRPGPQTNAHSLEAATLAQSALAQARAEPA